MALQLKLIFQRRFSPIFWTQFLGAFNDNLYKTALIVMVTFKFYEQVNLDPHLFITYAAGIFILPFFLFSATAGQIADKYPKDMLIKIIKMSEIIIMACGALCFWYEKLYILLFILFLMGVQSSFFGPIKYSILPEQLSQHELLVGNGYVEAGTFLAILLGTIFGSYFIISSYGTEIIISLILGISVLGWVSSLFIIKVKAANPDLIIKHNVLITTFSIMKIAREKKGIFACIIGISWFWLVGATYLGQFPTYVKSVLHANQEVVTFFLVLFSIGVSLGALLCNRILNNRITVNYVSIAAISMAAFGIDLYFASTTFAVGISLWDFNQFLQQKNSIRICIDLIGISTSGGIYVVPLYATMQKLSAVDKRARIIAANNIINALFIVLSSVVIVLLFKLGLSINTILLIMAACNIPVGEMLQMKNSRLL